MSVTEIAEGRPSQAANQGRWKRVCKSIKCHKDMSQATKLVRRCAGRTPHIVRLAVTTVLIVAAALASVLMWVWFNQRFQSESRAVLLSAGSIPWTGSRWSCVNVCQHHGSGAAGSGREGCGEARPRRGSPRGNDAPCPTLLSVGTSCFQELECKSLHGLINPVVC